MDEEELKGTGSAHARDSGVTRTRTTTTTATMTRKRGVGRVEMRRGKPRWRGREKLGPPPLTSALTRISVAAPKKDLSTCRGCGRVGVGCDPKLDNLDSGKPGCHGNPSHRPLAYRDRDQGLTHAGQRPCAPPIGARPVAGRQTLCCPPGTAPWGAWPDLHRTCIFSISMRCDHPGPDEGEKPPWILFSRQTEVTYRTFFPLPDFGFVPETKTPKAPRHIIPRLIRRVADAPIFKSQSKVNNGPCLSTPSTSPGPAISELRPKRLH